MLENNSLTEVVELASPVSIIQFETKGEVARYLDSVLKPIPQDGLLHDAGMWSWLALLFFESICPTEDGQRVVKNDYHYIFEPYNVRHFYRHLLFISWRVLQLAPAHNRLFLRSQLSTLDKLTTEVMKRLFLIRVPCLFEVLDRLYWDEKHGRPRVGMTASKPRAGDLTHRFPLRVRQLEMTYDLTSLTADQLIELLGDEFAFARPPEPRMLQRELSL